MLITRNKKNFVVSYKVQNSKKRKKILISRISQVKRKGRARKNKIFSKGQNSRKIASLQKAQAIKKQKNTIKRTPVRKKKQNPRGA